jgi:Lysozyme like domain
VATRYGFSELEALWLNAGGPQGQEQTAAAVALTESSGNPRAQHNDSNGTVDRGLWQINSVHGYSPSSSFDAQDNARQAVAVWRSSGWDAWSTFKDGAYLAHLPKGTGSSGAGTRPRPSGSGGFLGTLEGAAGDVGGVVLGGVEDAAGGFLGPAGDVLGIFTGAASAGLGFMKAALWLVSPLNWLRAAEVVFGFVLIMLGLGLAARADVALEQAGSAAAKVAAAG